MQYDMNIHRKSRLIQKILLCYWQWYMYCHRYNNVLNSVQTQIVFLRECLISSCKYVKKYHFVRQIQDADLYLFFNWHKFHRAGNITIGFNRDLIQEVNKYGPYINSDWWFLLLRLSGRRCSVVCICPSVCPSVRIPIRVRKLEMESSNLHQTCIMGYSWPVVTIEVIDLDLEWHFGHFI